MPVLIAVVLAAFSILCFKAGRKGFGFTAGVIAILVFVGWLGSGPGFAFLDWLENPSVEVPDNIPVPGQ